MVERRKAPKEVHDRADVLLDVIIRPWVHKMLDLCLRNPEEARRIIKEVLKEFG